LIPKAFYNLTNNHLQVPTGIDILENEIIEKYPDVLGILLRDHTTQKNIFWATDNYKHLGDSYQFHFEILPGLITGEKGNIIMPRVQKDKLLQQSRSKEMAEVFTPSWVCNAQNNLIDNAWFGRENAFNFEINVAGKRTWNLNPEKIIFPEGKSWKQYVRDTRLEITCGEAPYLASRYDTTTGNFIAVENRIGLLDRKLRVINENADESGEWLEAVQIAYKNTYGFEWQGDSLLLAREALLITFIENYQLKFGKEPLLKSIQYIAYIISWNIWQMDGLKGVVPNSCEDKIVEIADFFETKTESIKCKGCEKQNIKLHNGTYSLIKDWKNKDQKIRFVDLIKK
jgi:hypothetical protein